MPGLAIREKGGRNIHAECQGYELAGRPNGTVMPGKFTVRTGGRRGT